MNVFNWAYNIILKVDTKLKVPNFIEFILNL